VVCSFLSVLATRVRADKEDREVVRTDTEMEVMVKSDTKMNTRGR